MENSATSREQSFDISDPALPVMTIYTGESKEAAFAEVLAPFRPDLETIAAPSFKKVVKTLGLKFF